MRIPDPSAARLLGAGDCFPDLELQRQEQTLHSAAFGGYRLRLWLFRDLHAWRENMEVIAGIDALIGGVLPVIDALFGEIDHAPALHPRAPYTIAAGAARTLFFAADSAPVLLLMLGRDSKIVWSGSLAEVQADSAAVCQRATELAADDRATPPPVLLVRQALPNALAADLIACFQASERKIQGRVGLSNPRYDPTRKRVSHVNLDAAWGRLIDQQLIYSLLPMIERYLDFRVTHRVSYKIALYDASDAGFFHPHRDNSDPGTSYRRYALSVALNDDWQGGGLSFPEFGDPLYRIGRCNALVFPVSLLHQVLPVEAGQRYVLLSFLYAEDGARQRRAEMQHPELLDTQYPDAIDPALLADYRERFAPQTRYAPDYRQDTGEPEFIAQWRQHRTAQS